MSFEFFEERSKVSKVIQRHGNGIYLHSGGTGLFEITRWSCEDKLLVDASDLENNPHEALQIFLRTKIGPIPVGDIVHGDSASVAIFSKVLGGESRQR